MSDNPYQDNPYKRDRHVDHYNPYVRNRNVAGPVFNGGVNVVGSLTPEDIKAIAVAVVDELERRNRSIFD